MKVIIAGSRSIRRYSVVEFGYLDSGLKATEIVSGCARGVDKLGEQLASNLNIPCAMFPANWDKYGKQAGYLRNVEMSKYADALIAFWDGSSSGTKHMIDLAKKEELTLFVYTQEGMRWIM